MHGFTTIAFTDKEKTQLRCKHLQWTVKYRSRAPDQGACFKGMSITRQNFTLAATIHVGVEKTV